MLVRIELQTVHPTLIQQNFEFLLPSDECSNTNSSSGLNELGSRRVVWVNLREDLPALIRQAR